MLLLSSLARSHCETDSEAAQAQPTQFITLSLTLSLSHRLVGAIVVTQHRRQQQTCSMPRDQLNKYIAAAGTNCKSSTTDDSAYGIDSTFLPNTKAYDGKVKPETFYKDSER